MRDPSRSSTRVDRLLARELHGLVDRALELRERRLELGERLLAGPRLDPRAEGGEALLGLLLPALDLLGGLVLGRQVAVLARRDG